MTNIPARSCDVKSRCRLKEAVPPCRSRSVRFPASTRQPDQRVDRSVRASSAAAAMRQGGRPHRAKSGGYVDALSGSGTIRPCGHGSRHRRPWRSKRETDTPARSLATNVNSQVNTNNTPGRRRHEHEHQLPNRNMSSPARPYTVTSPRPALTPDGAAAARVTVYKVGTLVPRLRVRVLRRRHECDARSSGRQRPKSCGYRQHLRRHRQRRQEEQGVLLRIARGLQARPEPRFHRRTQAAREALARR